jgi:uncharacterized protein with PQ loop repeat
LCIRTPVFQRLERDDVRAFFLRLETQRLHGRSTDDVFVPDALGIRHAQVGIPDALWVHNHHGAVATLPEAAGLVDAKFVFQAALADFLLERLPDFNGRAVEGTRTFTDANEQVQTIAPAAAVIGQCCTGLGYHNHGLSGPRLSTAAGVARAGRRGAHASDLKSSGGLSVSVADLGAGEAFIWVGTSLFTLALLPQLWRTVKLGRADDFSLPFIAMVVLASASTLIYWLIHEAPFRIWGGFVANLMVWGLVLYYRIFPRLGSLGYEA